MLVWVFFSLQWHQWALVTESLVSAWHPAPFSKPPPPVQTSVLHFITTSSNMEVKAAWRNAIWIAAKKKKEKKHYHAGSSKWSAVSPVCVCVFVDVCVGAEALDLCCWIMSLKLPRNWDFSTFKAETARIGEAGPALGSLRGRVDVGLLHCTLFTHFTLYTRRWCWHGSWIIIYQTEGENVIFNPLLRDFWHIVSSINVLIWIILRWKTESAFSFLLWVCMWLSCR